MLVGLFLLIQPFSNSLVAMYNMRGHFFLVAGLATVGFSQGWKVAIGQNSNKFYSIITKPLKPCAVKYSAWFFVTLAPITFAP